METGNPWRLFEDALHLRPRSIQAFRHVLAELDSNTMGSDADRAELRASAMSRLAGLGDVPLSAAGEATDQAWALGRLGWPSLYLAWAALDHGDGQLALQSIRVIPAGYFDDQDLHWRTVQAKAVEAEACIVLRDLETASALVNEINHEMREEGDDELLERPVDLTRRLLGSDNARPLIRELFAGLPAEVWLPTDLAEEVISATAGD